MSMALMRPQNPIPIIVSYDRLLYAMIKSGRFRRPRDFRFSASAGLTFFCCA